MMQNPYVEQSSACARVPPAGPRFPNFPGSVFKRRRLEDSPALSMGSPLVPQSSVDTTGTERSLDITAGLQNKANITQTTPTPAGDADDLTAPGHSPFIEDAVLPEYGLWGMVPGPAPSDPFAGSRLASKPQQHGSGAEQQEK